MSTPLFILKKVWGYDQFRPLQQDIVNAVLDGKDVLALLPTGGGKSICFQVPALMKEGVCLVITPLIALMKDQVEQLKKREINAVAIFSGMNSREIDITLDNCIYGGVKFLYVSPERIKTDIFKARVEKMNVNYIVVDEAHCISQWGYDFRPSYLQIAELRKILPNKNIIALTATATGQVKNDIKEKLEFLSDELTFQASFARSNLSYSVRNVEDKYNKLLEVLQKIRGSAIVYVRTRKATKEVAQILFKNRISVSFYHGGLPMETRNSRQSDWIRNKTRVMVATNAFGMGIDKPDVSVVAHLDLPDTLEAYYQEAGRAGRNGQKAYAVMLVNNNDGEELKERIENQHPSLAFIKKIYQSLANYYKLAVGSSQDESFDFDITHFCDTYNYDSLLVYNAIKKLENEELLLLNEAFFSPSRMMFNIDNKGIYEFLIAHAQYDHFIKSILRIYGGEMFNHFTTISESKIAKHFNNSVDDVKNTLAKLTELNVVTYEAQKEKPQIVFVHARYEASELPLNGQHLSTRRSLAIQKAKSVTDYVNNNVQCRTQQLLYYFDEINEQLCGVCDNCVERKRKYHQDEHFQEIRSEIIKVLGSETLSLDNVLKALKTYKKEHVVDSIRKMLDIEELQYDDFGSLKLV